MFNITNHQGNANQNHSEILPHPCQNGYFKKTTNDKYWQGCREKRTLLHCWWEHKLVQSPWKTVWRFLKKLKIELSYNPAIPLLDVYSKKTKTLIRKDICTLMFTAALFTIAKIWKWPKCLSIDEWIKKIWYIYTMEYYSNTYIWNLKKKWFWRT